MVEVSEVSSAVRRALFGSIVRGTSEFADADAAIRRGVPTCRRVNFVSLRGGTGVSTAAASVATVLAQRRPRVLAIDGGTGRTLTRLTRADGLLEPPAPPEPGRRRTLPERGFVATTFWEATKSIPVSPTGLRVAAPVRTGTRQASPLEWRAFVEPVTRFFDVAVGDWGRRSASADLGAVVDDAHVVALVARADRFALEEALAHVEAIRTRSGRTPIVVAMVVDGVGPTASRVAASWAIAPVHHIPFDASAGTAAPASHAVREAYIHLAAALITGSLPPSPALPPTTKIEASAEAHA